MKDFDRIKNLKPLASEANKISFDDSKLEKALKLSSDELIAGAIRDVLMRDTVSDDPKSYRYDRIN